MKLPLIYYTFERLQQFYESWFRLVVWTSLQFGLFLNRNHHCDDISCTYVAEWCTPGYLTWVYLSWVMSSVMVQKKKKQILVMTLTQWRNEATWQRQGKKKNKSCVYAFKYVRDGYIIIMICSIHASFIVKNVKEIYYWKSELCSFIIDHYGSIRQLIFFKEYSINTEHRINTPVLPGRNWRRWRRQSRNRRSQCHSRLRDPERWRVERWRGRVHTPD